MAGPPVPPEEDKSDATPRCCAHEWCKRRPFFGPPGGKPLFCAQHSKKSEGMVDVSSRRCEREGCAKWPLYGNEGQKAKFCSMHKGPLMIDVRSRRCAAPDCKRQPSYGYEGSRACFCAAHKEDGMVDVVSRRCEGPHCRRRPLYGFEGQKSQFCSAHKQEGQVDVCNRRCQHPGCSKRPCFGFRGQRPSYCGTHRTPAMVDVISHKCSYPGCSQPTGYEANRVRSKFCDKHKTVGLAGASLLQLAGSKAQAPPPSPKKSSSPDAKPPVKCGSPPAAKEEDISPTDHAVLTGQQDENKMSVGGAVQADDASAREARATPTQRRASYAAPQKELEPALTPKRRSTLPATPLPPLELILERRPGGGLKRPREDGGKCLEDARAQQSPPRSPSTPVERDSSAPVHGPADPGEFVDSKDPVAKYGVARGESLADDSGRGCSAGSPPAASLPGQGGLLPAGDASAGPTASRPSARAKRLFPGAWNEFQAWGPGPEGRSGKDQVGYLTKSLAPDWRKSGLESLGRAMSFDEALQAVGREVLEPPQDGKPRRGSAFCVQAGIHPPVVTEVNRRDSALEPRPTPSRPPISHYSELLSAGQPFRSVTAAHGGIPAHGQPRPKLGADVEGEESLAKCLRGPSGQRRNGSGVFADVPTRDDWDSQSGFAHQPRREAGAAPSRASRLFHVMPAETPFTSGLKAPPRSHQEFRFRQDRVGPREGNTGSAEQMTSVVGTMHGLGAEEPEPTGSALGEGGASGGATLQGRRWSVLDSSVPPPPVAEANRYVLAWGEGAQTHEEETDMTPPGVSVPPPRSTSRRGPVFAGSGVGQADAEMPPRPPQPRRSSFVAASQEAEAMAGGMFRARRQRWSPLDDVPDPRENGASAPATYVAACGAPATDDQCGRGPARDEDTAAIAMVTDPYPGRSFGARRRGLFGAGCAGGSGGVGKGGGASAEMPLGRPPRGEPAHPSAAREGEAMGPLSQRRGWLPSDHVSMPTDPSRSTASFARSWRDEMNGGRHKEERQEEVGSERLSRGDAEAALGARPSGGSSRRGSLSHASSAVGNAGYAGMSGRHLHPG